MTDDKLDVMKAIRDIESKIVFHEKESAKHQAALRDLRKEKTLLISTGRSAKSDRE